MGVWERPAEIEKGYESGHFYNTWDQVVTNRLQNNCFDSKQERKKPLYYKDLYNSHQVTIEQGAYRCI